ncbi:NADH:ubiquinone oxidoreductase subunit A [Pandoraea communis]|uniref:NADH-quinone oxidoreductase subunit A n=1 Tax=Pandoraea communis TaxID=2508297 RepID=A0A5E4S9K5_9BURK|nr:NADH:ubiquinone oxidoreductase subunit A [Pandoraea communis]
MGEGSPAGTLPKAVVNEERSPASKALTRSARHEIRCWSHEGAPVQLSEYFPVLLFLVVALLIGAGLLVVAKPIRPHRPDAEKNSPYECGFNAFGDARKQFDVRYYRVAIFFIVFDIELAFTIPWAVAIRDVGWPGFLAMMFFLFLLAVGFAYEWGKKALEWE